MAYSFRTIYFFFSLFLLVAAFIQHRKDGKAGSLTLAVAGYWILVTLFFYKAVWYGHCLVPADYLFTRYPWKGWAGSAGPHNPLLGDAVCNFYPWIAFLKSAMEEGALPLWNFHSYSGSPFMANLASAQFNPFNIFLIFMDVPDFSTWFPFIRLIVSGAGTFLFLRVMKISPAASFFAGVLYCFCGVNIVWLSNYPNITVIMFLPWVMICMEKIAAGQGRGWIVGLVFCSAAQFLGGHPESSFHLYGYAGAYFIYRLYGRGRAGTSLKEIAGRTGVLLFAGTLSLGLVAFQLFPFLEYLPHTTRYHEIIEQGKTIFGSFGFFDAARLVLGTLINPDFFGNPVDSNYWEFANYNEQNSYLTVAGLFLSLVGMIGKRSDRVFKYFFIGAGLISFCIVARVPLIHELIVKLPGFAMAANYRLIFAVVFSLIVLAGFGMDELCDIGGIKPSCLAAITVLLLAAAWGTHYYTLPDASVTGYRLERLVVFSLLLAGVAALSVATRYSRKMISWFPVLVVILTAADVGYHGIDYNTFMEKQSIYPQTPLTRFISKEKGHSRTIGWNQSLLSGTEHVYGYDSISGYDPMKIYAYERILTLVNGSYNPVYTPEIQSLDSEWIHFLGVGHIATRPGKEDKRLSSDRFDLVYDGQDGQVYTNTRSLQRAFWGENPIQAMDRDHAFDFISKDGFSPLHATVVETGEIGPAFLAGSRNKPPVIEKIEGNEIKVRVENSSGLLVFSEVWFPGWKAYVDGERKEILRVNSTFMGVLVSPGAEEVRLEFCSDSFKTGGWVSLFSLGVCFLLVFLSRRKSPGSERR